MLRLGIVGAGRLAGVHLRHLKPLLAEYSGGELFVFDRNPERAAEFASQHGGTMVPTFDELLAQVDVVDIVTPNDAHAEFTIGAAKAGKHVFVEKPLAHNLETARTVVAELEGHTQSVVMVGHVVRYFPEFRRAAELIDSGKIGRVAAARVRRGGGVPQGAQGWFTDHTRSGGVFIDLAVHDFDWLLQRFGSVKTVFARSVGAKTMSGPDHGMATLEFHSGVIAHVEATWMDPEGFSVGFDIAGSEGLLQYDSRRASSVRTVKAGEKRYEGNFTQSDDPFRRQFQDFVNAIVSGQPSPVKLGEAFAALEVACAALESARTDRVIVLGDTPSVV